MTKHFFLVALEYFELLFEVAISCKIWSTNLINLSLQTKLPVVGCRPAWKWVLRGARSLYFIADVTKSAKKGTEFYQTGFYINVDAILYTNHVDSGTTALFFGQHSAHGCNAFCRQTDRIADPNLTAKLTCYPLIVQLMPRHKNVPFWFIIAFIWSFL